MTVSSNVSFCCTSVEGAVNVSTPFFETLKLTLGPAVCFHL